VPPDGTVPDGTVRLHATTRRIAGAGTGRDAARLDLLAAAGADGLFWHAERHALAGRGVALRIPLTGGLGDPDGVAGVRAALGAITVDDEVGLPGCGPVALGALPFDVDADGSLVVPAALVGTSGADAWVTTVSAVGAEAEQRAEADRVEAEGTAVDGAAALAAEMVAAAWRGARPQAEAPDDFHLSSPIPQADWRRIVAGAVDTIGAGELRKVVLARRVDVVANRPFVTTDVLARLLALYPSCMVFRVDGFIGASPELLIDRRGAAVESHPLAGTVARSGDLDADRALVAGLLGSDKDRREHAFVIDGLRAGLGPLCGALDVPERPSILELRNVSHLASFVRGELLDVAGRGGPPSALELVAAVHPTPAVGGTPSGPAAAYLRRVEGFDRGRYAGPVGWVDGRGDGTWAIGIRSADVDGGHASMYAGVGVVAGSEPAAELAETQLKLQALLAALVRP
jgi:menaquinone-specific isochorismate synthase